jgi:hypothetical protein
MLLLLVALLIFIPGSLLLSGLDPIPSGDRSLFRCLSRLPPGPRPYRPLRRLVADTEGLAPGVRLVSRILTLPKRIVDVSGCVLSAGSVPVAVTFVASLGDGRSNIYGRLAEVDVKPRQAGGTRIHPV